MSTDAVERGDICPKRFGLKKEPPCIILEYLQVSTGKLFHRRIGLRRLRPGSDASRVAEKMRQKNEALLAEDKVSFDQLVSLVRRLQDILEEKKEEKLPVTEEEIDYHQVDLNKMTPEEVSLHKKKMDVRFFENQLRPGDSGYVYDVQVDHPLKEDAPASGWDSESEDMDATSP
mmetsp:Transcript_103468/g.179629  ORF Transcript_103468/g.179629 Transcript_103468/m.179629 type:complete len:174 (+) Transcript_103468:64-585(+)